MRVGIDATNLRSGGGVTHLVELLRAADPSRHGFSAIVVWAARGTLAKLEPRPWLEPRHLALFERGFVRRAAWQRYGLDAELREARCDLLFAPGGSFASPFRPAVTMSRNLLPFESRELRRYGATPASLKMLALRIAQSRSYRRASGTIFLTRYAQQTVTALTGALPGRTAVIAHGVDEAFFHLPRAQRTLTECSAERPFRWLYVSSVDEYKHQWHVAAAVARLRHEGLPVALDLAGGGTAPALRRLRDALERLDPRQEYLRYLGAIEHRELPGHYARADGFVYASSCENLPNILLEAMASGLPIACSSMGPMPEVLGGAGDYFDPLDPDAIADALRRQLMDPERRADLALQAHRQARGYSWRQCADLTFGFLRGIHAGTAGA
jgi:glycosyltransferase involved in cell wall biosynthesis